MLVSTMVTYCSNMSTSSSTTYLSATIPTTSTTSPTRLLLTLSSAQPPATSSRIFPKSQKRQILEIFCKICFPYFARDKWSDHDSENCSEIRPVTRIRNLWRQSQILRKWPKIRAFQGSKSDSAFCKIRLPNFARDESSNHDFENCSKISSVTWFRICPGLLHFPTFMFFTPP